MSATRGRPGARPGARIPGNFQRFLAPLRVTPSVLAGLLAGLLAACATSGPATPSGSAASATTAATVAALGTPAPTPTPTPTPAISELTPNDLLLAAFSPSDVAALLPPTETWWPYFPEFNVGFSPYQDNFSDPSVRFFVAQSYARVDGTSKRTIQSAVILFEDATTASLGLARAHSINDPDSTSIDGPVVGDEGIYVVRHETGYGGPIDDPDTTTLRFRVGPVVGRISVRGTGFEDGATLADYAAPMIERIGLLLRGQLQAEPLPAEFAQWMPPPSDAVGAILGAVVAPVESWALVDTSGKPDVAADRLHLLGADSLGFGRASLAADSSQVIEATVLPFADAASASTWVKDFTAGVGLTGLDAGHTGEQSAFTSYDGQYYELQFATGRFVLDVSCFAPFGRTSTACEGPVRQLAEAWYAAMSGS